MSPMTPAYVAGLIDGEGCIGISHSKKRDVYAVTVTVGMTSKALGILTDLHRMYSGSLTKRRDATERWDEAWAWCVSGDLAAVVLEEISPHLRLKSEQARLGMKLEEIRGTLTAPAGYAKIRWTQEAKDRCAVLKMRMNELNAKGPSTLPPESASSFARLAAGMWVTDQYDLLSDVGACHRRERLFIVATPRDAPRLGVEGDWPGRVGIASALAGPRLPDRSGDVAADPGKQRRDRGTGLTGEGWQTAFGGEEGSDAGNSDRSPLTLLPTPAVNDMGAGKTVDAWDAWTDRMQAEHGNGNGHGKSLEIEALRLLPTPRTSDRNGAGLHGDGGADLRTTVEHLLPTPRAAERMQRNSADSGVALSTAVTDQDWGLYTAAIARHGRATQTTAPSPTEPGAKGQPRLSPRFVEWMMMQRAGWVTDVPGLTRNEQLKALGNGVVTPQAATALRWLLTQARAAADALEVSDA
jgi:site-specific DNA-cytosine methylase